MLLELSRQEVPTALAGLRLSPPARDPIIALSEAARSHRLSARLHVRLSGTTRSPQTRVISTLPLELLAWIRTPPARETAVLGMPLSAPFRRAMTIARSEPRR